jgi:hypothetical protein
VTDECSTIGKLEFLYELKGATGLVIVARPTKFPQIKHVSLCYGPIRATFQITRNSVSKVFYLNF